MMGLLLRFTLLLIGPLMLLAGLLVSLRLDEPELALVLTHENCLTPCLLGIEPGQTSLGEALSRLKASGWAAEVHVHEGLELVTWEWSGQQPAVIDGTTTPSMSYRDNIVGVLHLTMHIPFGAVLLQLGELDNRQRVALVGSSPNDPRKLDLFYVGRGYIALVQVDCRDLWHSPTSLILGASARYFAGLSTQNYELPIMWRIIRANCH
jgi:hypothetical protein